ncbi:helix-turn-helix transcriptional regulator [Microbacterium sp. B2969]|uniref:Helix-turn-helix transcriptional regulator n=1 Tax=Microbacterium alkaliflavum TaxID=3248839 RepID=A0ABW7QG81_9MICO
MAMNAEVREFLTTRRARLTPAQAGITDYGSERRVPGLRREEVADLAGLSLGYYTRIERGNIAGASDSVINAIADALQLDDVERSHLLDLVRNSQPSPINPKHATRPRPALPESIERMLSGMTSPAIVYDTRQNIVAANTLGRALYSLHFDTEQQPNIARFVYLDPRAKDFYVDYPLARRLVSGNLRLDAGRDPLDEELTAIVGELSTLSPQFRKDWANHNVHVHTHGVKEFRHPAVGVIEFSWDVLHPAGAPGLSIVSYAVEPDSVAAERLALLGSWAATA